MGDLEDLPAYSAWTEKRKVAIRSIWPQETVARATPTHLVSIRRADGLDGIQVGRLDGRGVLAALLAQTVIPNDRRTAAAIVSTVAATARRLQGLWVALGAEVYREPDCLAALEAALQ